MRCSPLGQQKRISERLIGLALGAGVIGPVAKRYAPALSALCTSAPTAITMTL
jgi:hypothetical protein